MLLARLRYVFAAGDQAAYLVPDECLTAFMDHCSQRIGEAYFRTPRTTITSFINLLSVLEQNPGTSWRELLGAVEVVKDEGPDMADILDVVAAPAGNDDLAAFRL